VSGVRNIEHSDVQATLRDMWETRPTRRSDERQVAGVAAAIARRYDVDPTLVRIGFVVAAFSGIGGALYIAGWIALPADKDRVDTRPPARRGLAIIGLVVAAAVTMGWLGGGPGVPSLLVGVALVGLLFLLHRKRAEELGAAGPTVATDAPTTTTAAAGGPSLVKEGVPVADPRTAAEPLPPVPPAWDPLGAAPFAWDLPEPGPAPEPAVPARRRAPVTAVTLGVALLAGAVTSVVMLLTGGLTVDSLPTMLGVLLAVVGTGLVVGSFLRAGRGLIPVALLLSALAWGALTVPAGAWESGFESVDLTPASAAAVQRNYEYAVGDFDLDLSRIDLSSSAAGNVEPLRSRISSGMGDVTVVVPEDADVTVSAEAGVGDLRVLDQERSGPGIQLDVTDLGADGVASGRPLVLDIEMGAGNVEVRRG
jgi:phage shock protein PspC (stress-responsive transcriptional regulator)